SNWNCSDGVYAGFTRAGRLVNWYWVLNVMPATPPVGRGLTSEVVKLALSCWMAFRAAERPVWNTSRAVPTGRSVVFHVMLVAQTASNFDRASSTVVAEMAGSSARTRMRSVW